MRRKVTERQIRRAGIIRREGKKMKKTVEDEEEGQNISAMRKTGKNFLTAEVLIYFIIYWMSFDPTAIVAQRCNTSPVRHMRA